MTGPVPGRPAAFGAAPGELELVRAFVNTWDLEQATDDLATPAGLSSWLAARGLASAAGPPATASDVGMAIAVREGLRGVLRAHAHRPGAVGAGGPAARDDAVARLGTVTAALATRLVVSPDGRIAAVAVGEGVPAAMARLLLVAAAAASRGTWARLKACAAADCQWAFYDRSPACTGCWCSMRACGSRAKSRAYRRRVAAATPGAAR